MKLKRHLRWMFLVLAMVLFGLVGCGQKQPEEMTAPVTEEVIEQPAAEEVVEETPEEPKAETEAEEPEGSEDDGYGELPYDGMYSSKEDVALYLHLYGELPVNYMTKQEAAQLGWEGGSLEAYAPGMCIGGDKFGNYEGKLPVQESYHECDVNTAGADGRGAERLVYSDSGNIYYTGDHYNTFEQLYSAQEDQ
ncbi:MAG: ribonuclease [Lachnospiraceae bacterium]|nr:ribonuclease [Lachnospiraceae bacterium]